MTTAILCTHNTSRIPEFGGSTWVRLQYLLGLLELGVDCYWVDHLDQLDPYKAPHSLEYSTERFEQMLGALGVRSRHCVVYDDGERCFGLSRQELDDVVGRADLLLSIGGFLPDGSPLLDVPSRAFVDVDPGFTQIWAHQVDVGLGNFNFFFTVGQNVGTKQFRIPTLGIPWESIMPPIHLSSWPARIDERCRRLSTVADWRGSQVAIFEEEHYATKRSEFIRYLQVPQRAGQRIELALCMGQHDHEDLGLLTGHDWRVRNAFQYAGDPLSYREYIQYSRAEVAVAKAGYVKSNSGWFSDRTACYLASGKPALVQSTGFEDRLPTGKGLLTFRSVEEAVAGIQEIDENYAEHCQAARRFAKEHLDSNYVLSGMLQTMGL